MFMAIVLESRMLRFIEYREIEFRQINQHRLKFVMLHGKLVKPFGDGRPDTAWPRAANDDMELESHDSIY
jgi:hypothetical protein